MSLGKSVAVGSEKAHPNGGIPLANGEHAAAQPVGWDKEANIHLRMMRASADVPQLEKDGKVDIKGGGYGFVSHDNVAMHAKKALIRHGVYFQPMIIETKQEGNRTEIRINGVFSNVDNPDDYLQYPGIGYGIDSSDKGPGKALSYACKMVLAKALLMNTAEDIEATDTQFEPDSAAQIRKEARQDKNKTLQAWASSYKTALSRATTLDELVKLQRENKEQLLAEETPDVTRDFFVDLFEQRKKLLGADHA